MQRKTRLAKSFLTPSVSRPAVRTSRITIRSASNDLFGSISGPYCRCGKGCVVASLGSNLTLVSRRHTRIHVLFSRCVAGVERRQNTSRRILFPRVIRFATDRTAILPALLRSVHFVNFSLAGLKGGDCTVGKLPTNIRGLSPMSLVQGVISHIVSANYRMRRRVYSSLTLSLTGTTTVHPKGVLSNRRVSGLLTSLFSYRRSGLAPSKGAVVSGLASRRLRGHFGWSARKKSVFFWRSFIFSPVDVGYRSDKRQFFVQCLLSFIWGESIILNWQDLWRGW